MQPLLPIHQRQLESQPQKGSWVLCSCVASAVAATVLALSNAGRSSESYNAQIAQPRPYDTYVNRPSSVSLEGRTPAKQVAPAPPRPLWTSRPLSGTPSSLAGQLDAFSQVPQHAQAIFSTTATGAASTIQGLITQFIALSTVMKAVVVVAAVFAISFVARIVASLTAPRAAPQTQLYVAAPVPASAAPAQVTALAEAALIVKEEPETVVVPSPSVEEIKSKVVDALVAEATIVKEVKAAIPAPPKPKPSQPKETKPIVPKIEVSKPSWPLPEVKILGYPKTAVTNRVDSSALAEQAKSREVIMTIAAVIGAIAFLVF